VRDWARSSDTLYVVTGCVLDGATYYALDRSNARITVPTAYYKAVLRYAPSASSTGLGHAGYMGCAVWLEHKAMPTSAKVDKTYSMSIDALEQKLGIDLFVHLPDKVGQAMAAQIEAEDPSKVSWWW
jgi:DNA/RNA endonuclease G (NUC1)